MLKTHKQALANQDLIDIWLYTFNNWGERQADKYHDELEKAFILLAENPKIGISCDKVRPGYLKFHSNKHLIMYRINGDTLHIIRVIGDDMDYESHL